MSRPVVAMSDCDSKWKKTFYSVCPIWLSFAHPSTSDGGANFDLIVIVISEDVSSTTVVEPHLIGFAHRVSRRTIFFYDGFRRLLRTSTPQPSF